MNIPSYSVVTIKSLTKDFDDYKQANNYEIEIEKLLSEKETLCRQLEDAYNCKNRNSELESVLMAAQKSNADLEEGLSPVIRLPHLLFLSFRKNETSRKTEPRDKIKK